MLFTSTGYIFSRRRGKHLAFWVRSPVCFPLNRIGFHWSTWQRIEIILIFFGFTFSTDNFTVTIIFVMWNGLAYGRRVTPFAVLVAAVNFPYRFYINVAVYTSKRIQNNRSVGRPMTNWGSMKIRRRWATRNVLVRFGAFLCVGLHYMRRENKSMRERWMKRNR